MAENATLHDLELGSVNFSAFFKLFPTLKSNGALQFEGSSWVLSLGPIAKCDVMYKSVFTWRHGGHIGVPKQWNCGHVGVPNQPRGSWTPFLCKRFLLFQWICIDAGHVSENTLLKKALDNDQNNSLPQELLLLTNNGLSNIKKRPFKEC